MNLDKTFVKSLKPSLTEAQKVGDQAKIATKVNLGKVSVNAIYNGKWSNAKVIKCAILQIKERRDFLNEFLNQIPQSVLEECEVA